MNKPLSAQRAISASRLGPSVAVNTQDVRQVGGISYLGSANTGGAPSSFTVTMTAPAGPALIFLVGDDGTGVVAGVFTTSFAAVFTQPTAVNGMTVAAFQQSFRNGLGVLVDSLNFNVTAAGNLTTAHQYLMADLGAKGAFVDINTAEGLFPDQFVNTRLFLKVDQPYKLDSRHAFTHNVPGGTTTTITYGVRAAAGR